MANNNVLGKLGHPAVWAILAAAARIAPHPANFTPIGALALFSGANMPKKQAAGIIIGSMLISDMFLGWDNWTSRLTVYGSMLLIAGLGMIIKNRTTAGKILGAALTGSILFFVITNFEVWAVSGMYAKTIPGLINAYIMAIPFFRNTVLGDIFFSTVLFGSYALIRKSIYFYEPAVHGAGGDKLPEEFPGS